MEPRNYKLALGLALSRPCDLEHTSCHKHFVLKLSGSRNPDNAGAEMFWILRTPHTGIGSLMLEVAARLSCIIYEGCYHV